MKILVVDDDKQLGARLCQHLGEYACEICPDFEQALQKVRDGHYDIIILDLFAGAVDEQNLAGDQILAQLWRHNFCPVIINSAAPDAGAIDKYCRNFFVARIEKGKDNSVQVEKAIEKFRPWVEKLQAVRKEAEDAMQLSLRDVVGNLAIQAFKDPAEGPEFLHRAARQRVAFQMSQPLANGELAPYEIYICPPPDEPALLQGSILMHKDADGTNPDGFRVVLTPSCDLVQERRVEAILTAKCIDRESLASDRRRRLQKRLYHEELVNLPAYPGVLPDMVADLKRLALISRDDIDAGQYTPVALLDSPFRETISWAYITVAGRPGLPDVDSD